MKTPIAVMVLALVTSIAVSETDTFFYDESTVRAAVYFASLSNLASAAMFSGVGERLIPSPYARDHWLQRAGYVIRPRMPDVALVGSLYASAIPRPANGSDPGLSETWRWDSSSFDTTLDPATQAWALVKIASPEFHLQYHDQRENRLAALMMIPEAEALARTLRRRLLDANGAFTSLKPNGRRGEPKSFDQAAVLWAAANLISAATDDRDDYFRSAYRDLTNPEDHRPLLESAFEAVSLLPPQTPLEKAIAIEALGRYALATTEMGNVVPAREMARSFADALVDDPGDRLVDLGFAIYGLTEGARLLEMESYRAVAGGLFRTRLLPMWDETAGLFRDREDEPLVYTPRKVAAVVAALDAVRWYGAPRDAAESRRIYPKFFQAAIVESGLLQASPLIFVSGAYRDVEPDAHFAHPSLPDPIEAGLAPVFASEVRFHDGKWTVSDRTFRVGEALLLANMLALRTSGESDIFLSEELLNQSLRGRR